MGKASTPSGLYSLGTICSVFVHVCTVLYILHAYEHVDKHVDIQCMPDTPYTFVLSFIFRLVTSVMFKRL